jgi:hypothetical protein
MQALSSLKKLSAVQSKRKTKLPNNVMLAQLSLKTIIASSIEKNENVLIL